MVKKLKKKINAKEMTVVNLKTVSKINNNSLDSKKQWTKGKFYSSLDMNNYIKYKYFLNKINRFALNSLRSDENRDKSYVSGVHPGISGGYMHPPNTCLADASGARNRVFEELRTRHFAKV